MDWKLKIDLRKLSLEETRVWGMLLLDHPLLVPWIVLFYPEGEGEGAYTSCSGWVCVVIHVHVDGVEFFLLTFQTLVLFCYNLTWLNRLVSQDFYVQFIPNSHKQQDNGLNRAKKKEMTVYTQSMGLFSAIFAL